MKKATGYNLIFSLWLTIESGIILCDAEIVKQQLTSVSSKSNNSCLSLNKFKCKSGECIDDSLKCEGTNDCIDGSDEGECDISVTRYLSPYTIYKKMCVIPLIKGIYYKYDSDPNIVLTNGTEVEDGTVIDIHCEGGYYYDKENQDAIMSCRNGMWKPAIDKLLNLCWKKCPPIKSDSLDLSCTYNGYNVDCTKQPSIPGTNLSPKCKSTHHLANGKIETPVLLQCDGNGTWIGGELYTCQPTCGQENVQTKLLIVHGTKAKYGTSPWNIGLYYMNNETLEYDLICGGTLISLNLIVSAAHCFEIDNDVIPYNRYKIAAGKYTRDITVIDNEFTQFINLQEVFLKQEYNGISRSFADDISIIVLETNVMISVVVSPICVSWKSRFYIPNGAHGKVVGWGITETGKPSPLLLEKELQLFDINQCLNKYPHQYHAYLTSDKICADDPLESGGVNSGDSGAGLAYKFDNSYYLSGIVSNREYQSTYSGAVFTNIQFHINWITQIFYEFNRKQFDITNIICSKSGSWSLNYRKLCSKTTALYKTNVSMDIQQKDTCVIPSFKGNLYYLRSKPNNFLPHGSEVRQLTTVDVKCKPKYFSTNASVRYTTVCKSNGEWSKIYPDLCSEITCPPQVSETLDLVCSYNDKYTDCSKPSVHGTKLIPKCKSTHILPNGLTETPIELHCDENGTWTGGELYTCLLMCGKIISETKKENDTETKYSFAPWIVKIYKRKNVTEKYQEYIEGSLISTNLVISNPYYFWDDKTRETTITDVYGRYTIDVGKSTLYDKTRATDFFDLLIVFLPESYNGEESRYFEDLAVILLDTDVYFNNFIAPVCIDWDNRYTILNGSIGKIFDWISMDDNSTIHDKMLEKHLPLVHRKSCRTMIPPNDEDQSYLRNDKFCSISDGEYNISGSYGTGLSFEHKNNHFLTGVLSKKANNSEKPIYYFTDVSYHAEWIAQIFNDVGNNAMSISNIVCSKSGPWSSTYRKLCSKVCPPKISDSLDISCTYNGTYVECANQLSMAGTILTMKCKSTHHLENVTMLTPYQLTCHNNGTWIGNELLTCRPICGRAFPKTKSMTQNGTNEEYGLAPWNVGIYKFDSNKKEYGMICGGTLISSNLVISAAYCFWDIALRKTTIHNLNSEYKVAIGQNSKDLKKRDKDMYTDLLDLLIIHLPEDYRGNITDYSDNIAVAVLNTKVIFSRTVSPICIDWKKTYTVPNGSIGKVITWDYTKTISTLSEQHLPFIDRKSCWRMLEKNQIKYITADKFCSRSKSDNLTMDMYAGIGFTNKHNDSQFLTGIKSGSIPSSSIMPFTDFRNHIKWIKELYTSYTTNSANI